MIFDIQSLLIYRMIYEWIMDNPRKYEYVYIYYKKLSNNVNKNYMGMNFNNFYITFYSIKIII